MNEHPTREEDFDLYALGALEGEEKQVLEAHLAGCAECARKLEAANGRLALLALAAPTQTPSARVRERLLRQIRAESRAPEKEKGVRWWISALAPAAIALAVVTIFLWVSNNRLNQQIERLNALTKQQEAHTRALLDLVTARDTMEVNLKSSPGAEPAQGHILYNARQGMVMYNGSLPSPPPDKTYQLWLVPTTGNPISAGVLTPQPSGTGSVIMTPVPAGITAKAFAVTLEPAGGRPQPTGPMIQIGPAT